VADELETVDLLGVEIMATGGPVFGVGSPPDGDYWTADDLRAMADADAELGDEIKPPGKIGHSDGQRLLGLTEGEMPAVGWVENVRVSDDGQKLLADFLRVPKKFAALVNAGGYRTRSVELSKVKSQKTQKVYDWVVTGVAWLGGKMPAVKTLDDVVALYEERDLELELGRVVVYEQPAEGSVVWKPEESTNSIRAALRDLLNPGGLDGTNVLWVEDISLDGSVALVCQGWDNGDAWVVPFTIGAGGEPTLSPSSDWVKAEKAWVAAAKSYAEKPIPGSREGAADTGAMKFTDEHKRKFSEATGVELDKVTDELLEAAGVTPDTEPGKRDLESDEQMRSFETRLAESDERSRKLEQELEDERKRAFVESVLSAGKAEPGQREDIEKMYAANPEAARKFFDTVKPNDDLAREYGAEGDGNDNPDEKRELEEREYAGYAASHLQLDEKEII
jgi:hypothetical protein